MPLYPCPCCGYFVFDEPPGSYDICAVCGWEDDVSQLRFPAMGGAQAPLVTCQGALVERDLAKAARKGGYRRDPEWRPLDVDRDRIEVPIPGVDYGMTYPDDSTDLYYWRPGGKHAPR